MFPFKKLSHKANLLGIPENWIVHEFFQKLIIFTLYSDLGSSWVFHGDTALRFFYDSPRFSLDLDFTGVLDKEKYNIIIDHIKSSMEAYTTLLGVSTNVTSIKYYFEKLEMLRFFIVFSHPTFSRKFRIKLEILNMPFKRYNIKDILIDIPLKSLTYVKVKNLSDILIDKICSFAGRSYLPFTDIFDIWFIRKRGITINSKILLEEFGLWKETLESLEDRIKILSETNIYDIIAKINDFLPSKSKLSSNIAEEMKKIALCTLNDALLVLKNEKSNS